MSPKSFAPNCRLERPWILYHFYEGPIGRERATHRQKPKAVSTTKGDEKMTSGGPIFPSAGRELLLELKRSSVTAGGGSGGSSSSYLPPYNNKLARQCMNDLRQSIRKVDDIVRSSTSTESGKPSMSARPSILFHHASIERSKRCLLAYHKNRLDALMRQDPYHDQQLLQTAAPDLGGGADEDAAATVTPQNQASKRSLDGRQQKQQQQYLHPAEAEFVREYRELRREYAEAVGADLDPVAPTSQHTLQVRVVRTVGGVVLDSGRSVDLRAGGCHNMARSDAVEFLRLGVLEHLDGEEVDF